MVVLTIAKCAHFLIYYVKLRNELNLKQNKIDHKFKEQTAV